MHTLWYLCPDDWSAVNENKAYEQRNPRNLLKIYKVSISIAEWLSDIIYKDLPHRR